MLSRLDEIRIVADPGCSPDAVNRRLVARDATVHTEDLRAHRCLSEKRNRATPSLPSNSKQGLPTATAMYEKTSVILRQATGLPYLRRHSQ